jgi:hypothetical protein
MRFQGYRCDYCPAIKGETNHWWMRRISAETFVLEPWDGATAGRLDRDDISGVRVYEHICSEQCAHTALSQWLSRYSANAPRSNAAGKEKS